MRNEAGDDDISEFIGTDSSRRESLARHRWKSGEWTHALRKKTCAKFLDACVQRAFEGSHEGEPPAARGQVQSPAIRKELKKKERNKNAFIKSDENL